MEHQFADSKRHIRGNNTAWSENSSAPNDTTVVGRSPALASDIPERHVVCRHAYGEGKIMTWEHMC